MHPLISVALLCSWLHTHSRALGLPNRQYVAINQRDGLQPSCTGIVPSNGQGTEIHVFKESRNQFLVIELIKKWLIETAGRVGNGTSQSLAEDWRLSIHQYQPWQERRLSSILEVTCFYWPGALNRIIIFTNF